MTRGKTYERILEKGLGSASAKYYNQGVGIDESELSAAKQLRNFEKRKEAYENWSESGKDKYYEQRNKTSEISSVSSSWLSTLGYSMETSEAVATFRGSNAEFFYKMPYKTFLEWYNSPSKGRWLHDSGYMSRYSVRTGGATPAKNRGRPTKNLDRAAGINERRLMRFGDKTGRVTRKEFLAKYR